MCFSEAYDGKLNGSGGYVLAMKALFAVVVDTVALEGRAGKVSFVQRGEEIGKIKTKKGKVIYESGLNHAKREPSHHTLHGHIHEVRVGLRGMMQCPNILGSC